MSDSGNTRVFLSKDFLAGALFLLIGGIVLIGSFDYPMGSVFRMGPGAFPMLVGSLTTLLGLALVSLALLRGGEITHVLAWRPLLLVTAAIVIFAFGLDHLGLIVSTVLLVVISRLAAPPVDWIRTAILACVLAIVATAIFGYFLRLPIDLWP